jgi:hypothetical protein
MKKLLSLFVLFFAFSLTASAQTERKNQSPESNAKQDLYELTKVIDVSTPENLFMDLNGLFVTKHNMLAKEGITENDKKEVARIIDAKLRATLKDDQIKKLESSGIYERLTH